MRILHINKFLWFCGGVERYMFDVADLSTKEGHEIGYFSMADERNIPCDQSEYFVPNLDYKNTSLIQKLKLGKTILERTLYSSEVKESLARLLREFKPDVAHIHLIYHHLSPSVLDALREANVPVVQTVHDFKLICPNYRLHIPGDHALCTRCVSGNYTHCIRNQCLNDSYLASALVAAEMTLHKRKRYYEEGVDRFICPSDFVREQLEKSSIPNEKLVHLRHYIDLDEYTPGEDRENYLVFVGRLVPEKGILTLLRAMAKLPELQLKVVGDGPLEAECKALIAVQGLLNVDLMGFRPREEMVPILANSIGLIFPSECHETCGLIAWEAHALEQPVIAASIGGIPESITEGVDGLLFEPGNIDSLVEKIKWLVDNPDPARKMGKSGAARVREACNAHYDGLLKIYSELT